MLSFEIDPTLDITLEELTDNEEPAPDPAMSAENLKALFAALSD